MDDVQALLLAINKTPDVTNAPPRACQDCEMRGHPDGGVELAAEPPARRTVGLDKIMLH